jgi:hydrogenase nickel incorporation protein HypA/HybF
MHELSLCLSLLEQLKTIAAERGASRVARIELTIGPLSGVETDLLRNAWPLAATGSIAVDAELVITSSDIIVRCGKCGAETPAQANRLVCGECGDFRTTLVSGDEMTLQRLELEASADPG